MMSSNKNNMLVSLIAASHQQQLLYSTEYRQMWIYRRASYSTVQTQILSLQIEVEKQYHQGCTVPATILQRSGLLRTQWDFMPNFRVCTHIGIKVQRSHSQLHWRTSTISFRCPSNIKESCCTWNKNSQQFIFLGLHGVFNVKITSSVGQSSFYRLDPLDQNKDCSKSAL